MANKKTWATAATNDAEPQIEDADITLVGSGIDTNVAGPLSIGSANATSIDLGAPTTLPADTAGLVQVRELDVGAPGSGAAVELSAAAATEIVNIGALLPAKADILGVAIEGVPFSGGGATAVDGVVGTAADDDALVAASDLLTAFIDGQASDITPGIAPHKRFTTAGAQLQLVVSVTGANANALIAGRITVRVMFAAQQ